MSYSEKHGLSFDSELLEFLEKEALPGTGIDPAGYFAAFSALVADLAPENRTLLEKRDAMQERIDAWHKANGAPANIAAYEAFLRQIGLVDHDQRFDPIVFGEDEVAVDQLWPEGRPADRRDDHDLVDVGCDHVLEMRAKRVWPGQGGGARDDGDESGRSGIRAGGPRDAGPGVERAGRAGGQDGSGGNGEEVFDSPERAGVR